MLPRPSISRLSHFELGNMPASVIALSATSNSPSQTDSNFVAGLQQFERREFATAATTLRTYVESHPSDAYGQLLLGVALIESGDRENAKQFVRQAMSDDTTMAVAQRFDAMSGEGQADRSFINPDADSSLQSEYADYNGPLNSRRWNFTMFTGTI